MLFRSYLFFFFFFKQKTAYEIYQCDWSSDVCSSDLYREQRLRTIFANTTGPTLPALLAERFRNILRNQEASLSAPEAIDMVTEKLVDELEHMKREVF